MSRRKGPQVLAVRVTSPSPSPAVPGVAAPGPQPEASLTVPARPPSTVTVAELAAHWKVSLRTIYRDIRKGALPAYRTPGGTVRIKMEDASAYGRPVE